AKTHLTRNNYDAAVNDYVKAGEIYGISKKYNDAIKCFTSAIDVKQDSRSALVGRAGAYMGNGDYRMSLADYEKALDLDKKDYQALYGSGVCYFKMSDHKKADKQFKKAYKINNNDPYLYQYMMLTQLARDNITELQDTYAEFKTIANPQELAEFKSSSRFEPILRLIKEENR
ncbi:MAG: tetratricopeptide repeat protein, partial [Candidatus Zixiibacteriota bacterium]